MLRGGNMKISTKGRYALRLMIDLAMNGTESYVPIKSVSQRQEISEKYLEQIIAILNKAGFVKSTRGAQGGYRLSRDPAEYTVGQILRLTEGSLTPVPCLDSCGGEVDCLRYDTCETVEVWKQLADAINGVVDNVTIADLAEKHAKRMESMNYMI